MKLIDAIVNVDRSPKTEKTVNLESLCHELGIFNSIDHEFDFAQRVKMYPIAEWAGDWDWMAGIYAVFFDDAPVGMCKFLFEDEDDFSFISVEIAQKLRNYILDNLTIKFNIIRDENIGAYYRVTDSVELTSFHVTGLYCNLEVTYVKTIDSSSIVVRDRFNTEHNISILDFHIPYSVKAQ